MSTASRSAREGSVNTFAGLYGRSKIGKTLQLGRAFPDAWWFGNKRGMQGLGTAGVNVVHQDDTLALDEMAARAQAVLGTPKSPNRGALDKISGIVCDDLSLSVDRYFRRIYDLANDKRKVYATVLTKLAGFIDYMEDMGKDFGTSLHERLPGEDGDKLGSPKLPSLTMSLELPKHLDIIYRMVADPMRRPWPASFWTNTRQHPSFVLGERRTVTPSGIAPPNLAEVLRAQGHAVRRPQAIEQYNAEAYVSRLADALQGIVMYPDMAPILQGGMNHLSNRGVPQVAIDWILQDGIARAEIRAQAGTRTLADAYGLATL